MAKLAVMICLAGPVAAQEPPECAAPAPPGPDIVQGLVTWIAGASGYDISGLRTDPPEVMFCVTGEMIAYEGQDIIVDPGLRAAYDARAHRIVLVLPWEPENTRHRATLLHELVHAAQVTTRDWPCVAAMEWDAYQLQARWMREHGIAPDFDWVAIYMLSRCPFDVHPE